MIYKFVVSYLILGLLFEFFQILFPIKKMRAMVQSFVLIIFLFTVVKMILLLI